ncbi:MAG: hypothetical protein HY235_30540 [Acidobacteria bacterium]|nr:hypothetical protein [Acidobacteriota bacterium]
MKPNLEATKKEIQEYLKSKGLAIFHGFVSDLPEQKLVLWDVDGKPDFREFVDCGLQTGARLMVFNTLVFRREMVDETLESLEEADMDRDEQRNIERRLKELRAYDGFTCSVEMSFEHQSRIYIYDLRTDWYEELLDLREQMDMLESDDIEDEDESMGGYFSRN